MRRTLGWVTIVVGALLVVGTFALDSFGLARSGERLIDGARPTMQNDVSQLRHDFEVLDAAGRETVEEAVPAIAESLGLTTAELNAVIEQEYPAVGEQFSRRIELTDALRATVTNLEAHSDDYEAADDLPIAGMSLRTIPVVLILLGVALVATGAFVLRRRGRGGVWTVAALGALLVVPTLALQIPQKSARAEDLVDSLNLTEETAVRTREQFEAQRAGIEEQSTRLFPDVADALDIPVETLVATLAEQFPDVGRGLQEIDGILQRIEGDVRFREQIVDEFADVRDLPLGLMPWALVAVGVVLLGLATIELARQRGSARPALPPPGDVVGSTADTHDLDLT